MDDDARGGDETARSDAPGRRPFLERPLAVVALVGGVLGIATALVTLLGVFDGGNGGGESRQAHIRDCMSDQGLARAVEQQQAGPGQVVFRRCTWPAPPGADADGFTEITLTSKQGPGRSEAEGLTVADVFASSCRTLEAQYLFDDMGTFERAHGPVRLAQGEVRRVENGTLWHPRTGAEASAFAPTGDQSIVLSNGRYRLDSVRCGSA